MTRKIQISVMLLWSLALLSSCSGESRVFFDDGSASLPMRALNDNGRKGTIANPGKSAYAYLALDERQLSRLAEARQQWGGLSCSITITGPTSARDSGDDATGQIAFGFLYQGDFAPDGKLKDSLADRPLARCSTALEGGHIPSGEEITLSMAIPAESIRDFRGILLHSTVPVSLVSSELHPLLVGLESGSACFFSSQGGLWDRSQPLTGLDLALAKADFDSAVRDSFGVGARVPVIKLRLGKGPVLPEDRSRQPQVRLQIGGEDIRIRRTPGQEQVGLHCLALENPFSALALEQGQEQVVGITMELASAPARKDGTVLEPLVTDPGMIPRWPKDAWRHEDYELFEWEQFPGLLFFDTANYKVQDDFFKRLAFFTEKTGYIGTLVSDRDLAGQHGFNAHDYRSETLADFFTLAEATGFPLNQKELLLRDILLHNGIIRKAADGYEDGYGAVISLSQESAMYLRNTFIAHEGFHGIFFVDEEFRSLVAGVYQNADPQSLRFLHRYFSLQASLDYNINDTYLMHNEFMAYVMQQSVSRTGAYFADNLARRGSMLRSEPELCAYIQSSKGEGFRAASETLSRYVFSRWGLEAGRVSLVDR
mgnify:CR=1 FL=1